MGERKPSPNEKGKLNEKPRGGEKGEKMMLLGLIVLEIGLKKH